MTGPGRHDKAHRDVPRDGRQSETEIDMTVDPSGTVERSAAEIEETLDEQAALDKIAKDKAVDAELRAEPAPAPPAGDRFEQVFDKLLEKKVPEPVAAVTVTPERQAHPLHGSERQAHAPHGQPARQSETAKSDPTSDSKPADREEQMAQRNAEINARVKAGKPVKPWNPVVVAKRAKSVSKAAKQKAAAAALAAILVTIGVCATTANAPARPAAAVPTASAAGEEFIPTAQPVRPVLPFATAAPIGATIVVTPHHSYTSGNVSACNAVQKLEPKTVSNPPVGASQSYEWQVEWPSCATGRSWGIDYQRPAFSQPQTLFPPRTTYTISPLERGTCSAGTCRQRMFVTVTNEGQ